MILKDRFDKINLHVTVDDTNYTYCIFPNKKYYSEHTHANIVIVTSILGHSQKYNQNWFNNYSII